MRWVGVFLVFAAACANGVEPGESGDDAGAARIDAAPGATDAAPGAADAAPGAADAAPGAADAAPGGSLDPELELPDPSGQVCLSPGSFGECPSVEVCRYYDATEGRCESCGPCGNLNASCSASDECDILFVCFRGRCTNFCTLGTSECGPPADCIDIGHPTRGACRP